MHTFQPLGMASALAVATLLVGTLSIVPAAASTGVAPQGPHRFAALSSDSLNGDWGVVELLDALSPSEPALLRWEGPFVDRQPIAITWLAVEADTGREWELTDASSAISGHAAEVASLPPHLRWTDVSSLQLWVAGKLAATADLTASQASATKRRALLQDQAAQPTGLAAWNPRTHGYVAAISFGLVMPLAAVISRCFREFAPAWFWLHMPLGGAATIGALLGVIFGAKLPGDGLRPTVLDAHKALGGLALALAGLQITALVLRPRPEHPKRYIFNHFHHNSGRLAITFGIANVYLGLHLADELAKFFWGYTIALGAIILLWVAKEAVDFVQVTAANRRAIKDGYEGTRLRGGYPMNGGFAATFLQRQPPPGSGIAMAGHGLRAVADAENPVPAGAVGGKGGKEAMYANSNPNSAANLLRGGAEARGSNVEMTFAH